MSWQEALIAIGVLWALVATIGVIAFYHILSRFFDGF